MTDQQEDSQQDGGRQKPWREIARDDLLHRRDSLVKIVGGTITDDDNQSVKHEGTLIKDLEKEVKQEKSLYPPKWKYFYLLVVGLYFAAHVVLGYFAYSWLSVTVSISGFPSVNVGLTVFALQALYFIGSLRIVNIDDLAGIDFFGRPVGLPNPGLQLIPRFLFRLTTISRNYIDVRFPGSPQDVHRISLEIAAESEKGDDPPEGKIRPIFITTGKPKYSDEEFKKLARGEEDDPLDRQMNVDISYFVRYRPSTRFGGIFRIMRNLSRSDFAKRAEDLLREQTEMNMSEIFSGQTAATIIENRALVNEVFFLKTIETSMRFGIQVDNAGGAELNLSHGTNKAQADAVRSRFTRIKTVVIADAEKQKLELEGEGHAEAKRLRLEALAKGYKKIARDAGVDGEAVLASETAKEVLEKADTIVVGTEGIKEIFGFVSAGKGMLERKSQPTTPTTPATEE